MPTRWASNCRFKNNIFHSNSLHKLIKKFQDENNYLNEETRKIREKKMAIMKKISSLNFEASSLKRRVSRSQVSVSKEGTADKIITLPLSSGLLVVLLFVLAVPAPHPCC